MFTGTPDPDDEDDDDGDDDDNDDKGEHHLSSIRVMDRWVAGHLMTHTLCKGSQKIPPLNHGLHCTAKKSGMQSHPLIFHGSIFHFPA